MRIQWVIGNWKMNGSLQANADFLSSIKSSVQASQTKMAICVPFPYIQQAQQILQDSEVILAAQDVSQYDNGAYTGEVSASMLKEFGVSLVLVGHSERRQIFGETDLVVAAKTFTAIQAGLTPIVCVGETLAEREAGQAQQVVLHQFNYVVEHIGAESLNKCILAYEPVWAIGTGKTATPEQAQEVHAWLRQIAAQHGVPDLSILYGGSVKANNAADIFGQVDVDGGLIGGASLLANEFLAIYQAA